MSTTARSRIPTCRGSDCRTQTSRAERRARHVARPSQRPPRPGEKLEIVGGGSEAGRRRARPATRKALDGGAVARDRLRSGRTGADGRTGRAARRDRSAARRRHNQMLAFEPYDFAERRRVASRPLDHRRRSRRRACRVAAHLGGRRARPSARLLGGQRARRGVQGRRTRGEERHRLRPFEADGGIVGSARRADADSRSRFCRGRRSTTHAGAATISTRAARSR